MPKIKASLLCHYGALDTNINAGIVAFEAALKAAAIDYGIYIHKGAGHAFFNDTKTSYNKAAADLAWRLTLAFFQAKLRDDRLAAHYKLDETEGRTAEDGVGANHGTLHGEPLWQPDGGRIKGAVQLDGIDDYLSAGFVLDPAAGPFSVFAWVKGVRTGTGDCLTDWRRELAGDGRPGKTHDRPVPPGRRSAGAQPAGVSRWLSTALGITSAWSGTAQPGPCMRTTFRSVRSSQQSLAGSTGGLNLGAGANLEPGAFFGGFIDDVRIYNQAVKL